MKKSILYLCTALITILAACGQKPSTTTVPTEVPTATSAPTPTTEPTATPKPTNTPKPTATPKPTNTPTPTPAVTYERARTYPDNTYQKMPSDYFTNTWAPKGKIVEFTYNTKNHNSDDETVYQKSALVYLPPCYDENDPETRYNIMYIMHGGGDSPKYYLGSPGESYSRIARMMDSMIEKGELEPLIVCVATYYTEYTNDATKNCLNFHLELMNDLVPAIESTYHTYARDTSPEELAATRTHRAFSGFSMGAVTTWSVFENCLDEFAYFMPVSGDCWAMGTTNGKSLSTAQYLEKKVIEQGKTAEDFFIYSGCGENDMAEPNLTPQIKMMKVCKNTFIYCDNFAHGNLYECIFPNGGHDVRTVAAVMYNGLPKMFH